LLTRKKSLVLIAALLSAASVLFVSRLHRTVVYSEMISRQIAERLAIRPVVAQPSIPDQSQAIVTRYATFSVSPTVLRKMDAHDTWLKLSGDGECSVLLTEIHFESQFTSDGNYTFYRDAALTVPVSRWECFCMSDQEFKSHVPHVVAKAANGFADRGITFFENQHSKGIVYHGSDSPTSIQTEIAIWDKVHPIAQTIAISHSDAKLCEQVADSIAATWQFTITELPDRDTLVKLANDSASDFTKDH